LKEEIRKLERDEKREQVDLEYLKNVILKLMVTNEYEALLPVISTLLQFSPDEVKEVKKKVEERMPKQSSSGLWGVCFFFFFPYFVFFSSF